MNERIKKLAEQAELPVIDGEWDYNDREILHRVDGEWRVATPAEIISVLFACEKGREKFAELIVRECVRVVDTWSDEVPCSEGYDKFTVFKLKEHFGIQE